MLYRGTYIVAKLYFGFQVIRSFLQAATACVLEDLNFAEDPLTLLTFNQGFFK